ncbi:pyridoxamine 5'-phosphate oxidase family protein [Candidatus Latescibacterota bacterium]
MAALPKTAIEAWEKREGPFVLTTVDNKDVPNAIFVTCVKKLNDNTIVICDNYFNKTRANITAGSKGSLLFITGGKKAFQIKGYFEYLIEGEIFENMKNWVDTKHPKIAASILHIEEVYSGSEKLA